MPTMVDPAWLPGCGVSPRPLRMVQRAWILLAAADGQYNAQIARDLGVHVDPVRTWRARFAADGMEGLRDRPRSGRPPVFAATVRAEVKALACSLPAERASAIALVSAGPGG
jgi:transposase